jgi:hypothetical protein
LNGTVGQGLVRKCFTVRSTLVGQGLVSKRFTVRSTLVGQGLVSKCFTVRSTLVVFATCDKVEFVFFKGGLWPQIVKL